MKKAMKITAWLFFITLAAALVYAVCGVVSILNSPFTSFPWWSGLVFAGIYFGPLLAAEGGLWLGLHCIRKRKEKAPKEQTDT